MKKVILYIAAGLLFIAGLIFFLYPSFRTALFTRESQQEIDSFRGSASEAAGKGSGEALDGSAGGNADEETEYENLLENMKAYNARIYEEKQTSLKDAWSYKDSIFDFAAEGIDVSMIGYITIDAMDVEIPLYVGASEENLRIAAAVLGQTSMPVGGENTNCVIAAHRGGYYGAAMFRDIELLKKGDIVEITNLWETLEYEVVKSIVISPGDIDAVKILEGEDMVTLVTCHPYPQNYQRYVVYCRRIDSEAEPSPEKAEIDIPYDGIDYEPSENTILREIWARRIALGVFILVFAVMAVHIIRRREKR